MKPDSEPAASELRAIRHVANDPRVDRGGGFSVAFLHPESIDGGMDPFLQIDAFSLSQPFFAPHPHAGFSAVTYIFPESPIGFINRDSLGSRQRIAPGGMHWTAAGRGVLHEEVPEVRGVAVLGLQMFINLPRARQQMEPAMIHLEPEEVPLYQAPGVVARVVFGASNGVHAAAQTPTPGARLVDLILAPGARFSQELDEQENCFAWIFAGSAVAGSPGGVRPLSTFDLVGYAQGGRKISFQAGQEGARIAICGGPPLSQPVVASGPFVMSTQADIQNAVAAYRSGAMGQLSRTLYGVDGRPLPTS